MAKQLSKARISHNIQTDIKRMRNLLTAIEKKPEIHEYLTNSPKEAFREYGIDLSRYATPNFGEEDMLGDIIRTVNEIVDGGVMERFKDFIKLYSNTSYHQNTETCYEYNFNHSTKSEYAFEIHTDSERGAFSRTRTGYATETDTRFRGFSLVEMKEILQGPMISEAAVEMILGKMQKTLSYAESQSVVPH